LGFGCVRGGLGILLRARGPGLRLVLAIIALIVTKELMYGPRCGERGGNGWNERARGEREIRPLSSLWR
jgi:hypothetical protein